MNEFVAPFKHPSRFQVAFSDFKSRDRLVRRSRGEFNRLAYKFSPTEADGDAKPLLITIHQH